MPKQQTYFEATVAGDQLSVLKTYDQAFAHDAFQDMDEPALESLWSVMKLDETGPDDIAIEQKQELLWEELVEAAREDWNKTSFFIVVRTHAGDARNLYVSPEWPSAEAFAKRQIEMSNAGKQ